MRWESHLPHPGRGNKEGAGAGLSPWCPTQEGAARRGQGQVAVPQALINVIRLSSANASASFAVASSACFVRCLSSRQGAYNVSMTMACSMSICLASSKIRPKALCVSGTHALDQAAAEAAVGGEGGGGGAGSGGAARVEDGGGAAAAALDALHAEFKARGVAVKEGWWG